MYFCLLADLELRDHFQATAWDYAKNKQLHYCQLIMMSHKRQSLQSSPRDTGLNGDGNLEPWMKSQENTPESTPGRIQYNLGLTDRSNNGDVSSRNYSSRNSANAVAMNNNNNNILGSKPMAVKVNPQHLQVYGTGNPVYSKMYFKENEVSLQVTYL